jgi:small conductance mechanosensitive channel
VSDVGIAYKEDTDRVCEVLREVSKDMTEDAAYAPFILEPLEILGVDKFGDSAVVIKIRIKTLPGRQWFVGREMNRRIKKRFDESGIEIPFPHRSLYVGEASKPFRIQMSLPDRDELRTLVREVIEEMQVSGSSGAAR